MKTITFLSFLFFSSITYADTHAGNITIIQSGHKPAIQTTSNTYVLITLSPTPITAGGCSTDETSRLLLDAGTEWGKVMLSHLLSAQARGQLVTIGTEGCISQSSSSKSWELINWVRSN